MCGRARRAAHREHPARPIARPAVRPRLVRRQQRQIDATGPGVHEGVVKVFDGAGQHPRPVRVTTAQQPQLFLLADVRQVPHQRAHQRVVLTAEFGVVEIDKPQSSFPRSAQIAGQCFGRSHVSPSASLLTVASMPLPITWSENSSAGQRPRSTAATSRCIASSSAGGTWSAAAATHRLAAA